MVHILTYNDFLQKYLYEEIHSPSYTNATDKCKDEWTIKNETGERILPRFKSTRITCFKNVEACGM